MSQETERPVSDSAILLPVIALPLNFETFFPKTKAVVDQRLMDWTPLTIARKMGGPLPHARHSTQIGKVLLLHQKTELEEDAEPEPKDLHTVGIVAKIVEPYDPEDGTLRIAIETSDRAIVAHCTQVDGYLQAAVKIVSELTRGSRCCCSTHKRGEKRFSKVCQGTPKTYTSRCGKVHTRFGRAWCPCRQHRTFR